MAVVVFKAPCVGPGCTYYAAGPEERSIPDAHLPELDPRCIIVIEATSEVVREEQPIAGTLLREHDWLRKATTEEVAEVTKLRTGPGVANEKPRRSNVIAGTNV